VRYFFNQRDIINIGVLITLLLIIVYYSYYISNTSGRLTQMNDEVATLRETLITVSTDHAWLDNKTKRLRKDSLDLELLDEQARSVLGYIRDDERLILPTR